MKVSLTVMSGAGSLKADWSVDSTVGLGGFLVHWRPLTSVQGPWATVELPSTARSYTIEATTRQEVQVRALIAGVSATQTGTPLPITPPPPPLGKLIVGVNGGSLQGPAVAKQLVAHGIGSERLEFNPESTTWSQRSLAESKANGFTNQTVIIGNIDDGTPLSAIAAPNAGWWSNAVAQAKICQEAGGVLLLECMNEPQFKGGVKDPVRYGQLYVELKQALLAHQITLPLGFTIFGDYQRSTGKWSDAPAEGWIADAVAANPKLPSLIDCLVHHTYGRVGEDLEENLGTKALEDERGEAVRLGINGDVYVTEMGMQFVPGAAKTWDTDPTEAGQAEAIDAVMAKLVSLGYVKGIWPYAMLDGAWSLPPAALTAIASFA